MPTAATARAELRKSVQLVAKYSNDRSRSVQHSQLQAENYSNSSLIECLVRSRDLESIVNILKNMLEAVMKI